MSREEYSASEKEQLAAWKNTERWREFGEKDCVLGTSETHPSYGMIGISRVSGNAPLFESEVKHMYYMALRIKEAERWQDGTHTRVHGRRELIEIHLTESQFAQLITSANIGDGVACTISHVAGDKAEGKPYLHPRWGGRPEPPSPERFEKKFHDEAGERAQIISENLANLESELQKMLNGETKTGKGTLGKLLADVRSARQQIDSNIPYVLHCAEEQLEKKIATAVVEFEGYVSESLRSRGLAVSQEQIPRLGISDQLKLESGEKK